VKAARRLAESGRRGRASAVCWWGSLGGGEELKSSG